MFVLKAKSFKDSRPMCILCTILCLQAVAVSFADPTGIHVLSLFSSVTVKLFSYFPQQFQIYKVADVKDTFV